VDTQNLFSYISNCIGLLGVLLIYMSFRFSRRESRLKSLSEILEPLVRGMQLLKEANDSRRKCEKLKRSFQSSGNFKEAEARIAEFSANYNAAIEPASAEHRKVEQLVAARRFRFPDVLAAMLRDTALDLSRFGELVNGGRFDEADVFLAKLKEHHKDIERYARGWRLADPFEWVRIRFQRFFGRTKREDSRFSLSDPQMQRIVDLVYKRATTQSKNTFAIHAPRKLLDDPSIAESDDVINQLENSRFEVVFQDGTHATMSLVELMAFRSFTS